MSRHKKKNIIQLEAKEEVKMTETIVEKDAEKEIESIQAETDRVRQELEAAKKELAETKMKLQTPPREYSDDELRLIEKKITGGSEKKALEEKIAKEKEYDNQMVTGRFMNRRAPGQPAKLTYMKYIDDPVKWYTFEDGATYTIKRGFADQINEHYHTPVFTQKTGIIINPDDPGSAIESVDRSNKKYAFVAVGY